MTKIPSKIENIKTIEEFNVFVGKLNPHVTAMGGRKFILKEDGKTYTYSLNKLLSTADKLDPKKTDMNLRMTLMSLSKDADSKLTNKASVSKNTMHKVRHHLGKIINRSSKKERSSLERTESFHKANFEMAKFVLGTKAPGNDHKRWLASFIDVLLDNEDKLNPTCVDLALSLDAMRTLKTQIAKNPELSDKQNATLDKIKIKLDINTQENTLEHQLKKILQLEYEDINRNPN